jgi:hypothetical protein
MRDFIFKLSEQQYLQKVTGGSAQIIRVFKSLRPKIFAYGLTVIPAIYITTTLLPGRVMTGIAPNANIS